MGFKETLESAADSVIKTVKETVGMETEESVKERSYETVSGKRGVESQFTGEIEPGLAKEHPEPLSLSEIEEEGEFVGPSLRSQFLSSIAQLKDVRREEHSFRPEIEVWPFEDDYAHWVISHEDPARSVICNTPEFKDSPFCGHGAH
jgi:hypothetical protein